MNPAIAQAMKHDIRF